MSPATTNPLSRTRSRMSTRPCVRDGLTSSGNQSFLGDAFSCARRTRHHARPSTNSPQSPQGAEVDVQVLVGETKCGLQLVHPLLELQEREAESLDLFLRQRASVHPSDGLMLQNLAQQ